MPTLTFFNLAEEKKNRIIASAVEEFARVRFSLASINKIVKAANISRGSFYQYFKDKEDVYKYILELITKEKLRVLTENKHESEIPGIFTPILDTMPAIFKWVQENPLYNKIGFFLATEEPELIGKVLQETESGASWFISYLQDAQNRGRIRKDADINAVVTLLKAYSHTLLLSYYSNPDIDSTMKIVSSFFDIIENGITNHGGNIDERSSC